ncbi:unnamed protein product [Choristocarpus tenellus]
MDTTKHRNWVNRIFPHARPLEASCIHWLTAMTASSSPSSSSSASIVREYGGPKGYLVRRGDDHDYIELLKETLVAYTPARLDPAIGMDGSMPDLQPEPFSPLPLHASVQQHSSMMDLIERVIKSLLYSSSVGQGLSGIGQLDRTDEPRRNVLSLGCRPTRPHSKQGELMGLQGVECIFPNTLLNALCSPPWECLHSRVGDDLMYVLLRQHTILVCLPNQCYLQLTGRPMPDFVRQLGLTSSASGQRVKPLSPSLINPSVKADETRSLRKVDHKSHKEGQKLGEFQEQRDPKSATGGKGALPNPNSSHVQPVAGELVGKTSARKVMVPRQSADTRWLPHYQIFYSSTFVRRAGFPLGHPLNPRRQGTPISLGRIASVGSSIDSSHGRGYGTDTAAAARHLVLEIFRSPTKAKDATTDTSCSWCGQFASQVQDWGGARGTTGEGFAQPRNTVGTKACPVAGSRAEEQTLWLNNCAGTMARAWGVGRESEGNCKDRRNQDKKGRGCLKMPTRLRKAVPLLEEVLKRSRACNYGRLLEAHCPLPKSFYRRKRGRRRNGKERGRGLMMGDTAPNSLVLGRREGKESSEDDVVMHCASQDEGVGPLEARGEEVSSRLRAVLKEPSFASLNVSAEGSARMEGSMDDQEGDEEKDHRGEGLPSVDNGPELDSYDILGMASEHGQVIRLLSSVIIKVCAPASSSTFPLPHMHTVCIDKEYPHHLRVARDCWVVAHPWITTHHWKVLCSCVDHSHSGIPLL